MSQKSKSSPTIQSSIKLVETDLLEVFLLWSNCPWPGKEVSSAHKQTDVPKPGSNQSKLEQSWPANKAECCWCINRQNKIYWGTTTETFHHSYLSDLQQEFFVLNWVLLVASPERRHWFTNSWKSHEWDSKIDTKYTWMDITLGWTWLSFRLNSINSTGHKYFQQFKRC